MATVLQIAKKLNKEYNDNNLAIIADIKPNYERMPTGSFGLDYPLFGGLVYGRVITFSGLEHSGKTTAACAAIAAYQKANPDKLCVFVDVEHSLDLAFQVNMNKLQLDKMLYVNPEGLSGEQILQVVLELQESENIGMIVIDSIAALLPSISLDKDMEEDPGMRGTIAKSLHRFTAAMVNLVSKKGNILLFVNQVRVSYTRTGAIIYTEPGGKAPDYYSSIKIRFGNRTFVKDGKTDRTQGEGAEGFRLKFSITKNKCAPVQRGGGFLTYSYRDGLMVLDDLLEIAYKFEFIRRINNVTYALVNLETGEVYKDEEGKDLVAKKKILEEYLATNATFREEYTQMLRRYVSEAATCNANILDEEAQAEIDNQEKVIEQGNKAKSILKG